MSAEGAWGCWLLSLWDNSWISLKDHNQERLLRTGRKQMPLPFLRKARRRICETTGLSASLQSVGRWWSNFCWTQFPNKNARHLTGISSKHKKNCFTVRMIKHWNRVPRDVMESPFLETPYSKPNSILKTHLVMALSTNGVAVHISTGTCQSQPLCD